RKGRPSKSDGIQRRVVRDAVARPFTDDVVSLVETGILPTLFQARRRCDRLLSEFQRQLTEVERKDQYGRTPRWRELEPSRNTLAQAVAWREYLVEREAGWRLRVRALRERAPNMFADADHRDEAAASHLVAALQER